MGSNDGRFAQDEVDAAWLYDRLAEIEEDPRLAEVYRRLAATERGHARGWVEPGGAPRPSWRARVLAALARRFGTQLVLPTLMARERQGAGAYRDAGGQAAGMARQERSHERVLGELGRAGGAPGSALARIEGRHRAVTGNALRAAVLGANDGLVSNLSLVMGVSGAALSGGAVLVTGLAGLVAGAGSMAMGEWLSVQSSRELFEHQIEIETAEIESAPEEEEEELALIYQAKGMPREEALSLAGRVMQNRETARKTLAREELGVDPAELGGSAWQAAATSFALFSVGAAVPVIPFFALTGSAAVGTSVVLSAVALFGIGAGITLVTGRGAVRSGVRQLLIGLGAAALTYGIGRIIGVSIG